jgi:hypothetical protein
VGRVRGDLVRVWDPSGSGIGQPWVREYTQPEWEDRWDGVALVLRAER